MSLQLYSQRAREWLERSRSALSGLQRRTERLKTFRPGVARVQSHLSRALRLVERTRRGSAAARLVLERAPQLLGDLRRVAGRARLGLTPELLAGLCSRPQRYPYHLAVLTALALAMFAVQPALNDGGALGAEGALPARSSASDDEAVLLKAQALPDPALPAKPSDASTSKPQPPLPRLSQLRQMSDGRSDKQQAPGQSRPPRAPIKYKVQEGDTISGIAAKFGVDTDSLLWCNEVGNPNSLQIGEELVVPPVPGLLHRVTSGDNLHDLASVYGVTPESIAEFNAIADPNSLQVGDLLVVPGGKIQLARAGATSRGGRPAATPTPAPATGSFRWPTGGTITQYFGEAGHSGLDIAAGAGSPIYAADSGVVVTALKLNYGYGWHLVVDHQNGYKTLYAHLSAFFVDYGERVGKGETIGAMGSTGLSTGPHLHFEVFRNGARVNPLKYLP